LRYGTGIVALLGALWLALPVAAQQLSGLARLEAGRSTFENGATEAEITLGLSQPVPFRAFLLDNPPRLVADFREVDFGTAEPQPAGDKGLIRDLRWGRFRPGWSRLVAELSGPARIETAVEETGDAARIVLRLARTQAADFAARTGAPGASATALQPRQIRNTGAWASPGCMQAANAFSRRTRCASPCSTRNSSAR
jgi:N-acetylmuramoyl-L-alanine amidase